MEGVDDGDALDADPEGEADWDGEAEPEGDADPEGEPLGDSDCWATAAREMPWPDTTDTDASDTTRKTSTSLAVRR